MTYAGLGAILARFVGVILIGVVITLLIPSIAFESSGAVRSGLILSSGLLLLPAVVLILASKPLGSILAAGLD